MEKFNLAGGVLQSWLLAASLSDLLVLVHLVDGELTARGRALLVARGCVRAPVVSSDPPPHPLTCGAG